MRLSSLILAGETRVAAALIALGGRLVMTPLLDVPAPPLGCPLALARVRDLPQGVVAEVRRTAAFRAERWALPPPLPPLPPLPLPPSRSAVVVALLLLLLLLLLVLLLLLLRLLRLRLLRLRWQQVWWQCGGRLRLGRQRGERWCRWRQLR